jgi:uncharacterized protein (TIGR01777 family)
MMMPMNVVLAGGSGFLGGPLRDALVADGHRVVNLTRKSPPASPDDVTWRPDGTAGPWAQTLDGADAVVNLAGEGIADRRWSEERKRRILESRLAATRSVVAACAGVQHPPRVLVSASAVGYYGSHGDEEVAESTPPGEDFLAKVCVRWEAAAEQASAVTRVALARSGVVLHPHGGALAKMLLPFNLGVGGPQGSGRQFMPWIHRDDWIGLVRWLISATAARGAFNATAPEPVTNKEFARSLGRALHRPAVMPTPTIALRLLFGDLADTLLTGQRAIPARALEMGFRFRFPRLEDAFADLFGRTR